MLEGLIGPLPRPGEPHRPRFRSGPNTKRFRGTVLAPKRRGHRRFVVLCCWVGAERAYSSRDCQGVRTPRFSAAGCALDAHAAAEKRGRVPAIAARRRERALSARRCGQRYMLLPPAHCAGTAPADVSQRTEHETVPLRPFRAPDPRPSSGRLFSAAVWTHRVHTAAEFAQLSRGGDQVSTIPSGPIRSPSQPMMLIYDAACTERERTSPRGNRAAARSVASSALRGPDDRCSGLVVERGAEVLDAVRGEGHDGDS
jgi:hypothetical protein